MRGRGIRSNRLTARALLGVFSPVKLFLAVTLVAQVSRDLRVPGHIGPFVVAAAVLAVALWLGPLAMVLLVQMALRVLGGRHLRRYEQGMRALIEKGEYWDDADFDRVEASMFRGFFLPWIIVILAGLPVAVVLVPFCFWLSAALCHLLGVQLSYPGFWPSAAVGAAILLASWAFGQVTNLVHRQQQTRRTAVANLYESAAVFLVLLLGSEVLGIVTLTDVGLRERLVALALFALLLGFARVQFVSTPWPLPNLVIAVLGQLLYIAVKLWGLTYASTVLLVRLDVSGFWSYLLFAALVVVTAWPARFISAGTKSNESKRETRSAHHTHHVDHMSHPHHSGPHY